MMQTETSGYVADTSALDHYVNQIVNPALENFDRVSSRLYVDGSSSFAQMLGHAGLPGSTDFANSCRGMLTEFFEAHRVMGELQQKLVATVARFRDNLYESSAVYGSNESSSAQSFTGVSARLDAEGPSNGSS
jgi:hypothetical protein